MKIINTPKELNIFSKQCKSQGKSIGLVPTMGYLHEGHKSLIQKSSEQNDITIVSIFVNPTQFGENEDLGTYPRDLEHDKIIAESGGADIIFYPTPADIYPENYGTYVNVESDITKVLCGASRPTHFRGVTTIVNKLFNISMANHAYFGQKDAQQLAVITRMVTDLNMNIEIVSCPIIRENDGLAMSSRNTYLTAEERSQALVLNRSLENAKKIIKDGERNIEMIKKEIVKIISSSDIADIDYVKAYTFPDLNTTENELNQKTLFALAVRFGSTRLIDNMIIDPNTQVYI